VRRLTAALALLAAASACPRNDATDGAIDAPPADAALPDDDEARSDADACADAAPDLSVAEDGALDLPEPDAMPDDDGAADDAGEDDADCPESRPDNPFLGCPELSGCTPHVCDVGGRTWEEVWREYKDFVDANPPCTPVPADLLCELKAAGEGADWPAQVERNIGIVDGYAGGLLPEQLAALRCLAYTEPSRDFSCHATTDDGGALSEVYPNLEVDLGTSGEAAAEVFLERYGALLGALFHVTPLYVFDALELPASWMLILRLRALSYAGYDFAWLEDIEIWLPPVTYRDPVTGGDRSCPGRYTLERISSTLSPRIEEEDLEPAHAIPVEDAVARALAACGPSCSTPPPAWITDPPALLFFDSARLAWRIHLACPSSCPGVPDWACEYFLDAHTGEVLYGGEECCVDC
jgi:hypothetical protein